MLSKITLHNFRNYAKRSFELETNLTLIVGPNAIGKTNILEAIYLLATGKSFRAETEQEVILEGQEVGRVVGTINNERIVVGGEIKEKTKEKGEMIKDRIREEGYGKNTEATELEIDWDGRGRFTKTYKVNGVGKRQVDFVGNLRAVLFSPIDMEIIVDSPSIRRRYLDSVLIQVHKDYRVAISIYERAIRQRNKLLWRIREENLKFTDYDLQLKYWNELIIANGKIIYERRKEYLEFLNNIPDKIFPIHIKYEHSIISSERLARYASEEISAAATLVGPHRDDFIVDKYHKNHEESIRSYGSRGEQRLAVFAIKLGELEYIKQVTGFSPLLLLDDIFSELDHQNRHHILRAIIKQQTIMTTTDLHLVEKNLLKNVQLVELE